MKVLIYFAVHERIEILKVCLKGIQRLKQNKKIEFSSLAVCSSKAEAKLLKAAGCHVVITDNAPLGRKKNTGIHEALKLPWDYLMELGSDDLVHDTLMDAYLPLMQQGVDFFGVRRVMFYDTISSKVAQWKNDYPIGAARMIKRSVFDGIKSKVRIEITKHFANQHMLGVPGRQLTVSSLMATDLIGAKVAELLQTLPPALWNDEQMAGMDTNSMNTICSNGFKITTVESEYWQVLDLKSEQNINTFDWFETIDYDVLQHYTNEAEMIRRL